MKCLKCSRTAEISYPNGALCKSCFLEILTNRIKKELRKNNPFERGEKVLVFGKLTETFLKKAIEGLPLVIKTDKKYETNVFDRKFSYDKVVIPWTADDEAELFYEEITKSKPNLKNKGQNQKIIKLFKPILDEELFKAAKILKISFKPKKRNKELERIQKKFTSAKFGLVKSAEEFRKAVK